MRLGDVADYVGGITFKPADLVLPGAPDSVVCMRTKNIQAQLATDDLIAVPRGFVKRNEQMLREGDVLVSSANSWNLVGKCCYVPTLGYDAAIGGFISLVRARPALVHAKYLFRWLSWDNTQRTVRELARQTTNIANLPRERFLDLDVPLPPLPEQRRIAAILDEADALRRKRREALVLLDDLLRSAFLDMFGDPVTNPRGWPIASLGTVSDVQGGLQVTPQRSDLPLECPYLRVANVYRDRLDLSEIKTIRLTQAELERVRLRPGDVLIVEGHGNPQEVGRSAVWNGSEEIVHQNHLIRVRARHEQVDSAYLSAYLNSPGGRRQMERAGKTTSGLNTISTSNVKAISVLLPPVAAQRNWSRVVDAVGVERERVFVQASLLDDAFAAILDRAFAGAL